MKKIRLAGTDITTSSLGFGCGQLMRISSGKFRQRLLNEAHDSGICHFDVARMYGLGAAEKELGKFARDKRDRLVIATKFGIDLNPLGNRTAFMQSTARRLIALFPALRRIARRSTGALIQPRLYNAAKAHSSLETSLRELRTDYIDIFLLHEPTLEDITNSDVLEFLEKARRQGKIRAYGVSGATADVLAIRRKVPELTPIVQIPNDAITRNIEALVPVTGVAVVTYSPFSNALNQIVSHVKANPVVSRRWQSVVGMDCASAENVAAMLLRYCLNVLSSGVVLFSTTKPERLRLLTQAAFDDSRMHFSLPSFLERIDEEIRAPNVTQ
jgi:D-threo-aldose 1-dehydrogenase